MKKNIYQFRGWEGVDVSNDISLFEYGILFNPNAKKNMCNVVYGIERNKDGEFSGFAYSSIVWEELIENSWIDWKMIEEYCGLKKNDEFSVHSLHSLVSYYGEENVFGTCYEQPFKINGGK